MTRALLALSATCLAAIAAAPAPAGAAEVYSAKSVVVGTMIPQTIATGSVPFDKTYAELTADQKAAIAQDYESIAPGDEPPFPRHGLNHMVSYLVRYVEMTNVTGSLVATAEIGPDGHARTISVYKSPDAAMTKMVTALLVNEDFKPALCGGSPCAMQYVLRLDFPARNGQHITGPRPGEIPTVSPGGL